MPGKVDPRDVLPVDTNERIAFVQRRARDELRERTGCDVAPRGKDTLSHLEMFDERPDKAARALLDELGDHIEAMRALHVRMVAHVANAHALHRGSGLDWLRAALPQLDIGTWRVAQFPAFEGTGAARHRFRLPVQDSLAFWVGRFDQTDMLGNGRAMTNRELALYLIAQGRYAADPKHGRFAEVARLASNAVRKARRDIANGSFLAKRPPRKRDT